MRAEWIDRMRQVYDARASIPFDGHTNAGEVERCVNAICMVAPELDVRVCDIGCGTGWHLRELARRGYSRLYGLDVSVESLAIATQRCANTCAMFICGDVSATCLREVFDVATVFNAALGSGCKEHDLAFLRGVSSLLADDGRLVMSYIPRELASRHVGEFEVAYCQSSTVRVSSSVRLASDLGVMEIRQKVGVNSLPIETLHLYTMPEMLSLMKEVGLDVVSADLNASEAGSLTGNDYLGWIVARKSRGQN